MGITAPLRREKVTEKNLVEKGSLYVVGTPIGNLGDLTQRAIQVLGSVDFIAAEDTRVTGKLMNYLGLKKPSVSYFEHNKLEKGELIAARIMAGESCALVSDAGMPAISDPGELLVAQCAQVGIPIYVVPGPSAVVAALALSGLPTGRFSFEGFLSVNKKSRREHLEDIAGETRTMVFYEAPHKLMNTLADLLSTLGDRRIAVARELTKLHEEVLRTTISAAITHFEATAPKGEFVLVVEGAAKNRQEPMSLEQAAELARQLVKGGASPSSAAREAAAVAGLKKGDIYKSIIQ